MIQDFVAAALPGIFPVLSMLPILNLERRKVIAKDRKVGRMFQLSMSETPHHACYMSVSKEDITNSNKLWYLWHHRLGYPHA
ncbi:hypothetical protein KY289_036520 [Solanum tuberosum]|nr:hypothetical protein KY289_036520 [Solanum tuberosum]